MKYKRNQMLFVAPGREAACGSGGETLTRDTVLQRMNVRHFLGKKKEKNGRLHIVTRVDSSKNLMPFPCFFLLSLLRP